MAGQTPLPCGNLARTSTRPNFQLAFPSVMRLAAVYSAFAREAGPLLALAS